ncbi:hypothetical protein MPHL21000_22950 [Mycolicibacterium phlei DSM 43239 = CCUG 21000]|uniref:Uncharacterized protein n=1 Tax=Mycolicibacterium phlei DSM 43239 = CCUG 21000 TaxID=1226750 RepID=A0A5N5UUC3_MYCPH|nr:hypothetical protein MPHL21000_22950 [Mycolicibacterium phlei DSM 43239 = CCUG 21000]KXW60698.1 hypothetical protein MPHL43239_24675 [Mycolicibacterium phlei DSM 43239 = CCUG 21000]KXW64881.1 hypothetical protein MPHL43070_22060 [Mycolicibacterium phlei DSM 43070]
MWAPPELRTFISGTDGARGPASWDASPSDPPSSWAGELTVAPVSPPVLEVSGSDDELDEFDEDESESSSAHAVPAPSPVATAAPTPSATARAPMRPM